MLILSYINIFGSGHFMAHIWKKHDFDGVDTTPKKQCFPRTKFFQICFEVGIEKSQKRMQKVNQYLNKRMFGEKACFEGVFIHMLNYNVDLNERVVLKI